MQIENKSFKDFSNIVVDNNSKILVWGIGTFFMTCIVKLLEDYHLESNVDLLIDGDIEKQDRNVCIGSKNILIKSPMDLRNINADNYVVLITSSYFAGIINEIDRIFINNNIPCFIAPLMFTNHVNSTFDKYKQPNQVIPKVIHYCWFGRKDMPEKNKRCIESWKRYCPDYEIIQWNEENYNLLKNKYMYEAYKAGKFGYVPDYARIDLLYNYGGIYFDTDVELINNIDELLYLKGFTSFEEYPMINFGGGSGSIKGLPILKKILDFREDISFVRQNGKFNLVTCGYYETTPLYEYGLKVENRIQNIEDLTILTSDYFHVKSTVTKEIHVKESTLGIHDFNWSWVSEKQREEQEKTSEIVRKYFG